MTGFSRLNRMHSKSFTEDNRISVLGRRKIGDEYFAAGGGVVFAGLGVAAVGAAVPAVSGQFNLD